MSSPRGPARAPYDAEPPRRSRGRLRLVAAVALVAGAAIVAVAGYRMHTQRAAANLHSISGQNVLLITIDTLRADALGVYGGPAATPALDRLAHDGVRFTFAHAHAVLTLPSHTSILTGQYPFTHGVRENSGYRLAAGARTIATVLKRAGYATGAFVAAFPVHSRFGLNQGFDVYDDHFGETRAPTEFVMPERPATAVVPLARAWIASHHDQRWFAWVHVFDPHAPYQPPPPFDREYAGRPYYGEVAATDYALAPLLNEVVASSRPTIVIVTGDHGESLGEHGEESHGLFAYESTLRIPLIIAEGGRGISSAGGAAQVERGSNAGEVCDVPVQHIDLFPTILDAVGQPIPTDLPGRSLLSAAERAGRTGPRPSYFEAMAGMLNRGWAPLTGVVADHDKFIDLPIPELYDLTKDPQEQTNLAGRSDDRQHSLAARLHAFGGGMPGARQKEDPQTLARLRTLGYVSGNAPMRTRYTEADDPKRLVDLDQAVHRGVELYSAQRFDEAEAVYRQILGRRPDMAIAYRHLAFVEWQRGKVTGAIADLQHAIAAGVTHTGVTTQLGTYLAETGNTAEALRLLEPLATTDATDADALNSLGIAYARAGRTEDARKMFERVLTIDEESSIPLENLGVLALGRGEVASARMFFERAVRADPKSSQAHAGLGVVLMRNGDRKAAVGEWRQAVEIDPTNFDALYNVATTLARDGQWAEAGPYLEQFVRSAPPAFYAKDIRDISALLQSRR